MPLIATAIGMASRISSTRAHALVVSAHQEGDTRGRGRRAQPAAGFGDEEPVTGNVDDVSR